MKRVLLAVCGIFMVLVSTGMLSATDSVVKAQSTGLGVTGQGVTGRINCGGGTIGSNCSEVHH